MSRMYDLNKRNKGAVPVRTTEIVYVGKDGSRRTVIMQGQVSMAEALRLRGRTEHLHSIMSAR